MLVVQIDCTLGTNIRIDIYCSHLSRNSDCHNCLFVWLSQKYMFLYFYSFFPSFLVSVSFGFFFCSVFSVSLVIFSLLLVTTLTCISIPCSPIPFLFKFIGKLLQLLLWLREYSQFGRYRRAPPFHPFALVLFLSLSFSINSEFYLVHSTVPPLRVFIPTSCSLAITEYKRLSVIF